MTSGSKASAYLTQMHGQFIYSSICVSSLSRVLRGEQILSRDLQRTKLTLPAVRDRIMADGEDVGSSSTEVTVRTSSDNQTSLDVFMADEASSSNAGKTGKDPRIIARKYQLDLCKKAMEENIIVYLGTGCGKTHIAVLLIYELGHLIRKPGRNVCVFLAPTVCLVQQQAQVIQDSTDFKVGSYCGNSKHLKSHNAWEKEIEKFEVLVMTPKRLLRNLHHCFIRMERIELLIFDECHHAQIQSNHPYADIMKLFYKDCVTKRPRIFGMTASPIVGKGASEQAGLPKCINNLESLLDAKVYSVEEKEELEGFVASPTVNVYYYDSFLKCNSSCSLIYCKKLGEIKGKCISILRKKSDDHCSLQNTIKLLQRLHDNLVFCMENLGLCGAREACRILLSGDHSERNKSIDVEENSGDDSLADRYLAEAAVVLDFEFQKDGVGSSSSYWDALKEPFFSKKLLVLIQIISSCRVQPNMKCIVFVSRIIVARSLAYILGKLKRLSFWKCHFLVGFHSGLKNMSRKTMSGIVEKFRSGELNLLVATKVGEEGLDIQTCCLVIRFDLPETVASFIQSRGRARMSQSEYAFLMQRGNEKQQNLINAFLLDEERMNKEITCRTSRETLDVSEETMYKVNCSGASVTAAYSVSLLHHYCSILPHDEYFNPMPEFFYIDDLGGTVCKIILPSNAAIHEIVGIPQSSKEAAKKNACLKACTKLHELGALTNYLLPDQDNDNKGGSDLYSFDHDSSEEENSRGELHEMLTPAALKVPWGDVENPISLSLYVINFNPIPDDRLYQTFGLFVKAPLPREAEKMDLELHLARGRIVATQLIPSGVIEFNKDEIGQAQNFQEMFLKILLDRSEFYLDFVPLGNNHPSKHNSSTFYLLLPVRHLVHKNIMTVDWEIVRRCLSSPIFRIPTDSTENGVTSSANHLRFATGPICVEDIQNSLVFTPHNKLFFFVSDILHHLNGNSEMEDKSHSSYVDYYKEKFGIHLLYPEQPLLKAKQLFNLRNLLHNRLQKKTEARDLMEHFVQLPPELCSLKIIGFSKVIGSSLSLLPSIMHRLENLLVAIELKNRLSASFPEGSQVTAVRVLEALTTEKCNERFSLERLEVLGDAFLKFAVGRHLFLLHEALDEGQLTRKRSSIVNNTHLYKLATQSNLQVYIRDQSFDPHEFFALGRPCMIICNKDTEITIHSQHDGDIADSACGIYIKCTKSHHWLHRKTIADVVEALVGAFIVDSGFKGATAFLRWAGIQVDFEALQVYKICAASQSYMALSSCIDIASLEKMLEYQFLHRGLLIQAFVHPSYNKHSGGCYQRLEFLGDAVLDYLITSYLYSVYPDLKPGELTDLRSVFVNNNSFANVAVRRSFHQFLISDSNSLSEAINNFVSFILVSASEKDPLDGPTCPKVLGDLVESCFGAVLLDTGFNLNRVWMMMLSFLDQIMSYSSLQLNPVRELQELCQSRKWDLQFPFSKIRGTFLVEAQVHGKDVCLTSQATHLNRKVAKRRAARELFTKLKIQGYAPKKNISLKKILNSSCTQEAKLIGFDETPLTVVPATLRLENSEIEEASHGTRKHTSNTKIINKQPSCICTPKTEALNRQSPPPLEACDEEFTETSEATSWNAESRITARSRLFEICAINYWKPPIFECCKDEGPSHLKLFTFKVIVQIEEASTIVLECFGTPQAKKKVAAERAAEGAIWYLKHQGYSSNRN